MHYGPSRSTGCRFGFGTATALTLSLALACNPGGRRVSGPGLGPIIGPTDSEPTTPPSATATAPAGASPSSVARGDATRPISPTLWVEPAVDGQTAPPPSISAVTLSQPFNVVLQVPRGAVTSDTITVNLSEPFGRSTTAVLAAQLDSPSGVVTYRTATPISFGGDRGGFSGENRYRSGTINDLVQHNADAVTLSVTTASFSTSSTLFVYDNELQLAIQEQDETLTEVGNDIVDTRVVAKDLLADPELPEDLRQATQDWLNGIEFRAMYLRDARATLGRARTPYETYQIGRTYVEILTTDHGLVDVDGKLFAMRRAITEVHDLNLQRGWTAGIMGLYALTAGLTGGDLLFELAEGKDIYGGEVHRGYVLVKIGVTVILVKAYAGLLGSLAKGNFQIYLPRGGSGSIGGRVFSGSAFGWSPAEYVVQIRTSKILHRIASTLKLSGEQLVALQQRIANRLRGGAPPAQTSAGQSGFGSAVDDASSWHDANTIHDAPPGSSAGSSGSSGTSSGGSFVVDGMSSGSPASSVHLPPAGPPTGWNANLNNPMNAFRAAMTEAKRVGVRNWRVREIIGHPTATFDQKLRALQDEIADAHALLDQINVQVRGPNIGAQLAEIQQAARRAGVPQTRINQLVLENPTDALRARALYAAAVHAQGFRAITRANFLRVQQIYIRASNGSLNASDRVWLQQDMARHADAVATGATKETNYFLDLLNRGYVALQNEGFQSALNNRSSALDLERWVGRNLDGPGFGPASSAGGGGRGLGTAPLIAGGAAVGLGMASSARASEIPTFFPDEKLDERPLPAGRFTVQLRHGFDTGMTAIDAPVDRRGQAIIGESVLTYTGDYAPIVVTGGQLPTGSHGVLTRGLDALRQWFAPTPSTVRATAADWTTRGAPRRGQQRDTRTAPRPAVKVVLTSLGSSTGRAVQMIAANIGTVPVELVPDTFVLEPLTGVDAGVAERELAQVPASRRVTVILNAYCLNRLRDSPARGTVFRIAPLPVQERAGMARSILAASQALARAGLLTPDTNPQEYFHAIRQWALWTHERGFNERTFTESFVEHARATAGPAFNTNVERVLRAMAPARWGAVTRILQEAVFWPSAMPPR